MMEQIFLSFGDTLFVILVVGLTLLLVIAIQLNRIANAFNRWLDMMEPMDVPDDAGGWG